MAPSSRHSLAPATPVICRMEATGAALHSHGQVKGAQGPSREAVSASKGLQALCQAGRCHLCSGYTTSIPPAERVLHPKLLVPLGPLNGGPPHDVPTAVGGEARNQACGCSPCHRPRAPNGTAIPPGKGST
ncbi:hypothetical protein NDU88_004146 [Pleurodeles waltl]|uniref:Uncharacterized protein n=1 Tax=Pleurodeles waltl TaxID=8319 RepID=A0AAV7W872_PLEWA|nr:hypothetical protein NDU88_004146 [Pleurodeles waltl]